MKSPVRTSTPSMQLVSRLFVLQLCLILPSPCYAQGGPKAALGFEEGIGTSAIDVSGHGNAGALISGPSWVQGRVGTGLTFDGVDDHIVVPASSSLDFTAGLTMSVWLKLRVNVTHPVLVIRRPHPTTSDSYALQFNRVGHREK